MANRKLLSLDRTYEGAATLGVKCTGMRDDPATSYAEITIRVDQGNPLKVKLTRTGKAVDSDLLVIRAESSACVGQLAQALIDAAKELEKYLSEDV